MALNALMGLLGSDRVIGGSWGQTLGALGAGAVAWESFQAMINVGGPPPRDGLPGEAKQFATSISE